MASITNLAIDIAMLLNRRNRLTVDCTPDQVLKNIGEYLIHLDPEQPTRLLACASHKRVQWYQAELRHVAVQESHVRKGVGRAIVNEAIAACRGMGVPMIQCTIRTDNEPALRLFNSCGFVIRSQFTNPGSGRHVAVLTMSL